MDTAKLKRSMHVNRNYKGEKCRDTNKSEREPVSLQTKLTQTVIIIITKSIYHYIFIAKIPQNYKKDVQNFSTPYT
jgi:hypothetical protein